MLGFFLIFVFQFWGNFFVWFGWFVLVLGLVFFFFVDSVNVGGLHQLHDVVSEIRKCLVEKATLGHPQYMEKEE